MSTFELVKFLVTSLIAYHLDFTYHKYNEEQARWQALRSYCARALLILLQGKRKKSSKPASGPKKRGPLDTQFTCLFCNHEKAVQVKIDKKAGIGDLYCKVCGQKFQSSINYLSAPVDVYSDWIDACESVAQDAVAQEKEATAEDKDFSTYASERPKAITAAANDEEDGGYDEDDY